MLRRVYVFLILPFANARRTLNDAKLTVDVVLLEPEQFRGSQSGCGAEDHHRSIHRSELRGDCLDLCPGLERPLLLRPPLRVRDTVLRRRGATACSGCAAVTAAQLVELVV